MVVYELELNQGDSNEVGMLLKENGVGVVLTDSTVVFSMKNEAGVEFDIACSQGGTVNGTIYSFAQGGITVPIGSTHTATPCVFQGKVIATKSSIQKTFPSSNIYITVKIWEAV